MRDFRDLVSQDMFKQAEASANAGAVVPYKPALPSLEWIRLQFVPSSPYSKASANFTGALGIKFMLQTRQHQKANEDEQFGTAGQLNLKEWSSDLSELIVFKCSDDKSAILIGDSGVPVQANARQKKGITDASAHLTSSDHNFVRQMVSAAVALTVEVPETRADARDVRNWYKGTCHTLLRDLVFEHSSAARHVADLIKNTLIFERENPTLGLYTDGGPDHNTTYISAILAMISCWSLMNLDMLVAMRTPAGLSIRNSVEHCMSTLTLGLNGCSFMRKQMTPAQENIIKSCITMVKWRAKNEIDPTVRELCKTTVTPCIEAIGERFQRCKWDEKPVLLHKAANDDELEAVYIQLTKLFPEAYDWKNLKKAQVMELESFKHFMKDHLRLTEFSIQIRKCYLGACSFHGRVRMDAEKFKSIPWVPTPSLNECGEHYKRLDATLAMDPTGEATDADLPSAKTCLAKAARKPTHCAKSSGLTIEGLKDIQGNMRAIVTCNDCLILRMVYSENVILPSEKELHLDTIRHEDYNYICGDAVVPESLPLAEKLCTRKNIKCSDEVNASYYTRCKKCIYDVYDSLIWYNCADPGEVRMPDDGAYAFVRPTCSACHREGFQRYRLAAAPTKRK
ncbi:hypothetical protein SARC_03032 [Sphaeroforma arctica JP610]|uniref:Uncharacterized protein n=1 Tax=Sphaeroforma arctica JP610 TaxID=667725 RepID=A0A0L0G799_9EUKA|nr:hypothetical protein SARC_03032 [Sphaeroforma arctica JP610]KNC84761.1 hypothetical protein SARC_03032 [Sphaeroforma arctica JP610]|eukprot:XP_014158663.1 hypothetical protein SARC_03032 [Sphaeroforma arctica JP610]